MIRTIHGVRPQAPAALALIPSRGDSRSRGRGMIGVDLFAGAGGLSLGAVQAGIDVRLAVEADPHAVMTYQRNHPKTRVLAYDIRNLQARDLPKDGTGKILFGGPPCQGFSTSNQRTRKADNPSNWLFQEFMRVVKLWQPDWVVLENVKGLVETADGIFIDHITGCLKGLDYTTDWWVLNAADFGVPQKRWRLFVIGSRNGKVIPKPSPMLTRSKYVTVRHAIGDLPDLANGASTDRLPYGRRPRSDFARAMRGPLRECGNNLVTRSARIIIKRYANVPPGGNWADIPARLMRNYVDRTRCHTGIYHRLQFDAPSVVIGNFRKNMLIHPTQDRGLSAREAARLQSFPDWYEFKGSIGFQQQQVGNAVPPLLAKVVFERIMDGQRGGRPCP